MRDELETLLGMLNQVEETGGIASLTISTKGGKTSVKFAIELDAGPSTPTPVLTSPSSPPAPGNQAGRRRHRNRGAAARARRNQRAAASQAALSALAEVDPPPPRPLCHLLSPSPTSRRRRVMSVGRPEMPTFSSLNLDGSSSPSPDPPPCSPPSPWICYDDCNQDEHCSDCGKCNVLCQEHSGCDCDCENVNDLGVPLEITFHCAVCFCDT